MKTKFIDNDDEPIISPV